MRKNQPVTNEEVQMAHGQMLVTKKADTRGIITYATQAAADTSGYREKELAGAPHNPERQFGS